VNIDPQYPVFEAHPEHRLITIPPDGSLPLGGAAPASRSSASE
jgi:hypothetical protein